MSNTWVLTRILRHLDYGEIGGVLGDLGLGAKTREYKSLIWTRGDLQLSREIEHFDWENVTEEMICSHDKREIIVACAPLFQLTLNLGVFKQNDIYHARALKVTCTTDDRNGTCIFGKFIGLNADVLIWHKKEWTKPTELFFAFESWFGKVPVQPPLFLKFVVS